MIIDEHKNKKINFKTDHAITNGKYICTTEKPYIKTF